MFKKSDDHRQLDAFSSPTEYFKDTTKNYYLKNKAEGGALVELTFKKTGVAE